MKIDETPFVFGRDASRAGKLHHAAPPGLDELELSFLELLGSGRGAARSVDDPAAPLDFTSRVPVVERERLSEAKSPADKAAGQPGTPVPEAPKVVEDPRADVQKELEMLRVEMTAEDLRYMKEVVIPGLPILQGSVPLAQALATDAAGKLDTRGLAVSAKLSELIEKGIQSGRPVRVELDGNSSVVLKFKNGRVSAEFLSNDRATAMYLKQNLDELRSRLEAKNLPVDLLQYKEQRQNRPHKDSDFKE